MQTHHSAETHHSSRAPSTGDQVTVCRASPRHSSIAKRGQSDHRLLAWRGHDDGRHYHSSYERRERQQRHPAQCKLVAGHVCVEDTQCTAQRCLQQKLHSGVLPLEQHRRRCVPRKSASCRTVGVSVAPCERQVTGDGEQATRKRSA
jgi:hypothetical protein